MAMSLAVGVPSFAGTDSAADGPAIPPGQENLILQMLGVGAPLSGCDLVDGQVHYTTIKATYACDDSQVEYQLAHRSKAGADTTATDQFAVTLTSGSPPSGFADALVGVIRSREGEFEWLWLGGDPN
jgi:hypothetical protein